MDMIFTNKDSADLSTFVLYANAWNTGDQFKIEIHAKTMGQAKRIFRGAYPGYRIAYIEENEER